jgi:hypothetical protein
VRQSSDAIGQRGESIFVSLITKYEPGESRLFRPQFLGDKSPFVDFIVFLDEPGLTHLFFLVQVKATRKGYTVGERRLKVQVSEKHIQYLASCPAPTYVVGIDEETEVGYLVSANGEHMTALSSLSTGFLFDKLTIGRDNRAKLRQDVTTYWQQTPRSQAVSLFQDKSWR